MLALDLVVAMCLPQVQSQKCPRFVAEPPITIEPVYAQDRARVMPVLLSRLGLGRCFLQYNQTFPLSVVCALTEYA